MAMGRPRLADDFDERQMGLNPYAVGLKIKSRRYYVSDKTAVVNTTEGYVTDFRKTVGVTQAVDAERDESTKVYRNAANRANLGRLPARASHLFVWLVQTIKAGKDYVIVNIDLYLRETETSKSTFQRAVRDLVDAGILYYTRWGAVFWINPTYFYNGNRLSRYGEDRGIDTSLTDELK